MVPNSHRRSIGDPASVRLAMLALCLVAPLAGIASNAVGELPAGALAVETGPLYATPSTLDRAGRILVPVEINGRGPFLFILDTGANRSALSARTVETLGLARDPALTLNVHGVTGTAVLPAVQIAVLTAGDVRHENLRLPVLGAEVFADADGILGIDSLQDARIEVDFIEDRVTVRRTSGNRAPRGYLVVPARLRHGGLLLVNGRMGKVRIKAILDTGAEKSLGNDVLRTALGTSARDAEAGLRTTVLGATPDVAQGSAFETPAIALGEAWLRNLVVTFGDFHVFNVWDLDSEPALLIGMDLLGTLQSLVIDYPRREFQLLPQLARQPTTRPCGPVNCARLTVPRR